MHLKIFLSLCFLCVISYCSKDCELQRSSVWSRYTLKCARFGDVCPLRVKTPGVGGIETVKFAKGCPSPQSLDGWIKQYRKVLYSFTKYVFNCSCESICANSNVNCLNDCPAVPNTKSQLAAVLWTLFGTGGGGVCLAVAYKMAVRYWKPTRGGAPVFVAGDGVEDEHTENDDDAGGSTDADAVPAEETSELKVVDGGDNRKRDAKGRFVKVE